MKWNENNIPKSLFTQRAPQKHSSEYGAKTFCRDYECCENTKENFWNVFNKKMFTTNTHLYIIYRFCLLRIFQKSYAIKY